jgi:hypothetical protein
MREEKEGEKGKENRSEGIDQRRREGRIEEGKEEYSIRYSLRYNNSNV